MNHFDKLSVIIGKIRFSIISILLASMILIPAGCSSSTEDIDEDAEFMEKYEATVVDMEAERVTIKFRFPGQKPKNWDSVRAEMEERISSTINAGLDFQWFEYHEYIQKMSILDASDEPFDAFCLAKPNRNYPNFTKLSREGKLKDISDMFLNNAPTLFNKYTAEELDFAKVDGKLYAVPSIYPHAYCTYLMVDDALFSKYKLADITNYEEYEAYLKAVKENEPDIIPGTIANSPDSLSLFARASGYVIVDEIQKLVYKWDDPKMKVLAWERTPEFKEAADYITRWYKNGYLVSDPDQSKTSSFIFYGMLNPPMNQTTTLHFSSSSGEMAESNPLRVFYLYPDKQVQLDNPMGSFFFNGSFVFPESSINTERALMFLDWVQQSRENYYLTMNGIEGTDYVLKDNYPTLPEGMDYNNRTYMYWGGYWSLQNIEYIDYPPGTKDANGNEVESYKDFLGKYSKYPPHGALYPNYKEIETAADSRSTAFQQFESNLSRGLINDFFEIDTFIKNLEDLGSINLVEIVQKQMNAAVDMRR